MSDPGLSVYSSVEVVRMTGVTYRQLDHWCRKGYVSEAQEQMLGSGRQRVFRWREYVRIRRIAALVSAGMAVASAVAIVNVFEAEDRREFDLSEGVTLALDSKF